MTLRSAQRLRVVVIDDEKAARDRVRRLLAPMSDIDIVGEAGDGPAAIELIRTRRPDGVFLDISMPGLSGLELVRRLPVDARPAIVITTAHADYAVEAFDLDVVDYLVKPYGGARLERACARLRASRGPGPAGWIAARDLDDRLLLSPDRVTKVVAEGNYIRLHGAGRAPLVRSTLGAAHRRLQPFGFVQVNRSTLIRAAAIVAVRPLGRGDLLLELEDGDGVTLSRNFRDVLDSRLIALGSER